VPDQALFAPALELYRIHCERMPDHRLQKRLNAHPPAHAMAALVSTLKLFYGLDGRPRVGSSGAATHRAALHAAAAARPGMSRRVFDAWGF
jgi:hypothetical protein